MMLIRLFISQAYVYNKNSLHGYLIYFFNNMRKRGNSKSLNNYTIFQGSESKVLRHKVVLPPIITKTNASMSLLSSNWKYSGNNSPLAKYVSNNVDIAIRKSNVVMNIRRSLKNPYSYISNYDEKDIKLENFQSVYRDLAAKIHGDEPILYFSKDSSNPL